MSARKGVFFLAFASGKEKKRWQLYSLVAQAFGLTMCKVREARKGRKKENHQGQRNEQTMHINSQYISDIHSLSPFHGAIDSFAALQTDFFARFFRRKDKTSARSSATGDLHEANGGFSRRLRDLLTGTGFIFKIGSSFVQNTPHDRTSSIFWLESFLFYPHSLSLPTAQILPKSAHSPIFQDTALWNLIQLDFLSVGMRFVATDRELAGAKIVGEVSARRACRTSFFALLPIFPNCIPQGAKKKQVFRLYAFGKGKHSTGFSFNHNLKLWK